jgi:Flp pilus assembly protein TadG
MRHVGYGRARAGSVAQEIDRGREGIGRSLGEPCRGAAAKGRMLDEECGSSLIELALVLPIVFLMTFGLINFALVAFGINNIQYASRSAMRYACIHSSTSLQPATTQSVSGMIQPFLFQYPHNTTLTTVAYGTTGNVVGSTVGVTVTITYTIRLPGYTLNGPTLTAQASGVITQ